MNLAQVTIMGTCFRVAAFHEREREREQPNFCPINTVLAASLHRACSAAGEKLPLAQHFAHFLSPFCKRGEKGTLQLFAFRSFLILTQVSSLPSLLFWKREHLRHFSLYSRSTPDHPNHQHVPWDHPSLASFILSTHTQPFPRTVSTPFFWRGGPHGAVCGERKEGKEKAAASRKLIPFSKAALLH